MGQMSLFMPAFLGPENLFLRWVHHFYWPTTQFFATETRPLVDTSTLIVFRAHKEKIQSLTSEDFENEAIAQSDRS